MMSSLCGMPRVDAVVTLCVGDASPRSFSCRAPLPSLTASTGSSPLAVASTGLHPHPTGPPNRLQCTEPTGRCWCCYSCIITHTHTHTPLPLGLAIILLTRRPACCLHTAARSGPLQRLPSCLCRAASHAPTARHSAVMNTRRPHSSTRTRRRCAGSERRSSSLLPRRLTICKPSCPSSTPCSPTPRSPPTAHRSHPSTHPSSSDADADAAQPLPLTLTHLPHRRSRPAAHDAAGPTCGAEGAVLRPHPTHSVTHSHLRHCPQSWLCLSHLPSALASLRCLRDACLTSALLRVMQLALSAQPEQLTCHLPAVVQRRARETQQHGVEHELVVPNLCQPDYQFRGPWRPGILPRTSTCSASRLVQPPAPRTTPRDTAAAACYIHVRAFAQLAKASSQICWNAVDLAPCTSKRCATALYTSSLFIECGFSAPSPTMCAHADASHTPAR